MGELAIGVGKIERAIDLSCPVLSCPSANAEGRRSSPRSLDVLDLGPDLGVDVVLMAQREGGESCPLTIIGKPWPHRSSELRPVKQGICAAGRGEAAMATALPGGGGGWSGSEEEVEVEVE